MTPKDGEINSIRLALLEAGFCARPHTKKRLELSGDNSTAYEEIRNICSNVSDKPIMFTTTVHGTVLEFEKVDPNVA